ncbi:MAG: MarR family transcriptional regulator [Bacteroidia bacterium]|nr:MarR family transcriptional regulator [Bacteroidia bacterium]
MKIEEEIKQTVFRNPHQKAGVNLILTYYWLINKHKDFFKPYGITNQQFNILRILKGQYPKSISGADIKERMLDKNSDVSRLIDRLLLKKLVTKSQCPSDRRAADVSINENGLNLLSEIDTKNDSLDNILGSLTAEEASQLSTLLDKSRE